MAFGAGPGVKSHDVVHACTHGGYVVFLNADIPAMEASMNPLDSITGTIVGGVILALILAALF